MADSSKELCVLVPAYREEGRIGGVVHAIRKYCPNVVVVDDGSPDKTGMEAGSAGAEVVTHDTNKGKGVALNTGFQFAINGGYSCVITMDGDGQHDPADIPAFIESYRKDRFPVIIGNRMHDQGSMPLVRRLTNRFMSWLLSRKMRQHVPDTQSGYRLFECSVLKDVSVESERFAAESEILLVLSERGCKIGSVPIKVIYRDEKSKINPIKDTIRFFAMLRRHESGGR